jgi:colanic acid/amylovoran biosynthesis protein
MQPRIYEIRNVNFINKGAELMLMATADGLRRIDGSARIALRPSKAAPYERRILYNAYQKIGGNKGRFNLSRPAKIIPKSIKNGLGLVTDEELFGVLDASGYAYGGDWNPNMLTHASYQARQMQEKGGLFIALPQAFGEFNSGFKIRKIRRLVSAADMIFARDNISRVHLEAANVDMKKVFVSPDFTATVPAEEVQLPPQDYACIVPNTKILSKMNRNQSDKLKYYDFLVKTIRHLRRRIITPYFVLHNFTDDIKICQAINSQIETPVSIINQADPRKIKYLLGHAVLNICSRYHACISGLSEGIPTLGTSWSHKYEMLYREYNIPDLVLADDQQTEEIINHVLTNRVSLSDTLKTSTAQVKTKIDEMWALIGGIIQSKIRNKM